MATTTTLVPVTTTPTYVDCGAVAAGTLLALAITVVLLPFGNALGLSFDNLTVDGTVHTRTLVIVGLWTLWVQLMSAMAGAYLAGRILRTNAPNTHESELRDGAHGLVVWASSTVLMAIAVAVAGFFSAIAVQNGVQPEPDVTAEMARKIHIVTGFSLAATSLVAAAAAWGIATLAGDHRDSNSDVSRYVSFRRKAAVTTKRK